MADGAHKVLDNLSSMSILGEDGVNFYDALTCNEHNAEFHKSTQKMCTGHQSSEGRKDTTAQEVLFNHLIFNRIVEACDVATLKSIRLVCFAWYHATLETWRKVSVVRFHDWDIDDNLVAGHLSPNKFLSLMTCPPHGDILYLAQYPPQRLRLLSWIILESHVDRAMEEGWLWRKIGPLVKYLHLDMCSFSENNFHELVTTLLPHLEHLKISGFGHTQSSFSLENKTRTNPSLQVVELVGTIPFSTWSFLEGFPNLCQLHLQQFSKNFLFDDLRKIRLRNGYTTHALKTIDVINTSQRMQGLVEAKFPLEHLTLRLNAEVNEREFKKVLTAYGPNLKSLKLFRFPIAWPAYAPFRNFPFDLEFGNLKSLEIWGNVITSFNFLRKMPLLEELKVDLQCFEKMKMIEYWRSRRDRMVMFHGESEWSDGERLFGEEGVCGVKLEKLHTLEVDYRFGKGSMEVLGKWMPNLKRLATVLDNETLAVVCQQWSGLSELRLMFGSEVDDNGIIGNGPNCPGVPGLDLLESFEMASLCGESKLTENALRNGFLKIPGLSNLKICVSPQVSLEYEVELVESSAIQNLTLVRNYGEGPHFNDFQCCRRNAFLKQNAEMPYN